MLVLRNGSRIYNGTDSRSSIVVVVVLVALVVVVVVVIVVIALVVAVVAVVGRARSRCRGGHGALFDRAWRHTRERGHPWLPSQRAPAADDVGASYQPGNPKEGDGGGNNVLAPAQAAAWR